MQERMRMQWRMKQMISEPVSQRNPYGMSEPQWSRNPTNTSEPGRVRNPTTRSEFMIGVIA